MTPYKFANYGVGFPQLMGQGFSQEIQKYGTVLTIAELRALQIAYKSHVFVDSFSDPLIAEKRASPLNINDRVSTLLFANE